MLNAQTFNVMIGKNVTADATTILSGSDIDDGEIVVIKPDMTLMTAGETISDAEYFYVVQGLASNEVKISNKVQGRNVTKWEGSAYTAAVEQVSYIGNNGTDATTDITASNETEYTAHVIFKWNKDLWSERRDKRTYHYTSDASATNLEIATELAALMNADDQFSSQAIAAVVDTAATQYGIRITGLAQTYSKYDTYQQVNFELALEGGFSTTTTIDEYGAIAYGTGTTATSVAPSQGVGTYAKVSELEYMAQGYEGITNRTQFPVPTFPEYATSGTNYDMLYIEYFDRHESADQDQRINRPAYMILAIPTGTGLLTAVKGVLNPYMASTPKAFPAL
jgi:hypothetical protein